MERGSDKHSPRQDDVLAHEVEGLLRGGHTTHAEEWKDPEPSGEDQPQVSRSPEGALMGGVPEGVTHEDVEGRSELARHLGLSVFPGDAATLLAFAERNEAPERVLDELRSLPQDRTFVNVQDVWGTLGGGVEAQRS